MARKLAAVVGSVAFLATVCAIATSDIFFLTTPSDTSATVGQTVTLYCSINRPGNRYMWIKDDTIISQGYTFMGLPDPSRFSIIGGETSYHLRIANVQAYDTGSYKCIVTSGAAGILSDPAYLNVQSPPTLDLPECASDAPLSVAIGEVVHISCTVPGGRPSPDITMYRDYNDVARNSDGEDTIGYTWTVQEQDEGVLFKCEGSHDLWAETRNCQVGPFTVVTDPVQVVLVPLSEIVDVGGSTSFVCHQSAPVRSAFKWFIDGVEVDFSDKRFAVQSGDISSILRIDNIPRHLDGKVVACNVKLSSTSLYHETVIVLREAPVTRPPADDDDNKADDNKNAEDEDGKVEDSTDKTAFTVGFEAVPGDKPLNNIALIIAAIGICGVVILIFIMVVLAFLNMVRRKRNDPKVITDPIVLADTDDYYFKSKFVNVQKTWFGPVHNDTLRGISNSFPMEEGQPRITVTLSGNKDETTESTDA